MNLIPLLLLCLGLTAAAALHLTQVHSDGRVKVDLYMQSRCPDCHNQMQGSFKTAINTKDFQKICGLDIYPYGNADRNFTNGQWQVTCQHGDDECLGNLIQTCAIKIYDKWTQAFPYVWCLESSYEKWEILGPKCTAGFGISWDRLKKCYESMEGLKYTMQMAEATEKARKISTQTYRYSPQVVVNREPTDVKTQERFFKNVLSFVCQAYQGPQHIEACQQYK